ncbi:MAG: OmpA family protein [Armatimonadetes bacterium]|nr:OmpA family protein [Armatimonadota bacterium]
MAANKKGHKEEEHENLERWLITYADMITLLMAFFIMMYAMSVVNKGKFAALAVSVRTGFGGPVPGALPDVLNLREHTIREPGAIDASEFELLSVAEQFIKKNIAKGTDFREPDGGKRNAGAGEVELSDQVTVVARDKDLIIRLKAGPIVFPRGSAELTAACKKILDVVSDLLAYLPNPVRIEGHTCDLPIHTARYPSNWELSAQRAVNVLTYLVRKGIEPSRLSAVGYADTRPLVPNIDEAHRSKNRRVDIVLVGALEAGTKDMVLNRLGVKEAAVKKGIAPNLERQAVEGIAPKLEDTAAGSKTDPSR